MSPLAYRAFLLCFALCLRSWDRGALLAGVVLCVCVCVRVTVFRVFTVRTDDHPVEVPGVPAGVQGDLRRTRPFGRPHEMVPHRRPR